MGVKSFVVLCTLAGLVRTFGTVSGTLDPSFNPGGGANALIWTAGIQTNGQIVVGGNFTTFDGQPRSRVARLNTNGSLDLSFAPAVNGYVRVVRIQPDNRIILGGDFTHVDGVSRNRVARLHENGTLDPSFDPGLGAEGFLLEGPCHMFDAVIQKDGKIIFGGTFRNFNGIRKNCIVRVNSNGSLDDTFLTGTGAEDDWVRGLLVLPDDKILVCGWFERFNGEKVSRMIRLEPNGIRDPDFAPFFGSVDPVYQVARQSDGKLTIVGHFSGANGQPRGNVARLNADGTLDEQFDSGAGANGFVESVVALQNGRALVSGYFSSYKGKATKRMAVVDRYGNIATNFVGGPSGGSSYLLGAQFQADGKLLIYGDFSEVDGLPRKRIARISPPIEPLSLQNARFDQGKFICDAPTVTNKTYHLMAASSLTNSFQIVQTLSGDGAMKAFQHVLSTNQTMFYKIEEQD